VHKRRIHILHHAPALPGDRPPLLFVHGGYVDARCWQAHFLPFFASRGFDCYAPDLSGHGHSDGRQYLDALSLDDYLADVTQVVDGLGRKPVVIGHSMGAVLAERLLEQSLAEAGVLMSPVPPNGTLESAINLFLRYPRFLGEVANMTRGVFDAGGLRVLREVYFTPQTRPETLLRLAQLVQPESQRAVCDMALLGWRWPPRVPAVPVLVIGGELDAVFPPHMVQRVARRWNGELTIVPAAGHAMILDQHWQACAAGILSWLERLEARPAPERFLAPDLQPHARRVRLTS
jgi:pimeloyl-ACP methyl ester carboxylesterase